MPPKPRRSFGVPARPRSPRRTRLAVAGLIISIVTAFGATLATARVDRPVDPIDARVLTPVVPPAAALPAPTASFEPVVPEAIGDFRPPERSFAPRPEPSLPNPLGVIVKPTPTPRPTPRPQVASGGGAVAGSTGHRESGTASWYCLSGVSACHYQYSGGLYAAAGPALRVGSWRGRTVRVCGNGNCVNVKLIDWCQCYGTRVIDLYSDAFRRIAPLSAGTTQVTVTW